MRKHLFSKSIIFALLIFTSSSVYAQYSQKELPAHKYDEQINATILETAGGDMVYFEDDIFKIEIELVNPQQDIPDGTEVEVLSRLFNDPESQDPIEYDVFQDGTLSSTDIEDHTFIVEGIVTDIKDKTGVIGLNITLLIVMGPPGTDPTPEEMGDFPMLDTDIYNPDESDKGLALVGVRIPESANVISEPHFSEFNLYGDDPGEDRDISFIKAGSGSITFQPGLNIIDNREELHALDGGLNIIADPVEELFYSEIDPLALSFLSHEEAVITLENIPEEFTADDIDVIKSEFGEDGGPESTYEASNINLTDGAYSFTVSGFSRYSLFWEGMATQLTEQSNYAEEMVFYPNPFSDKIVIKNPGQTIRVIITNIKGGVVLDKMINDVSKLNTSFLPSGYYIVKAFTENGNITVHQMIKQ